MDLNRILFWMSVTLQLYCTDCLECYSCTNVSHVASCLATITCPPGEICHTSVFSDMYTLGCKDSGLCPVASTSTPGGAGQIVGRALTTRLADGCAECCETGLCNRQLCQNNVNGGWSVWSSWGSCSVTCGIGLQRRDRSCSHPYHSNTGEHCYGDSRDDQMCITQACQDGGWTAWDGWTSCDSGTRKRSRSCSNPSPSLLGRYCTGDPMQVETCGDKPSQAQEIGFMVFNAQDTATSGHITFTNVVTNLGGGFNAASGQFTCSVAGVYSFSARLTLAINSTNHAACSIYKNSQRLGRAEEYSKMSTTIAWDQASAVVYVHLLVGDKVYLQECTPASTMQSDTYSTFTGYLIHSD